jgi:hypothetical protein
MLQSPKQPPLRTLQSRPALHQTPVSPHESLLQHPSRLLLPSNQTSPRIRVPPSFLSPSSLVSSSPPQVSSLPSSSGPSFASGSLAPRVSSRTASSPSTGSPPRPPVSPWTSAIPLRWHRTRKLGHFAACRAPRLVRRTAPTPVVPVEGTWPRPATSPSLSHPTSRPAHDFTAGPAHLAPGAGYADLQRGPSPSPSINYGGYGQQYNTPNPYDTYDYQGAYGGYPDVQQPPHNSGPGPHQF